MELSHLQSIFKTISEPGVQAWIHPNWESKILNLGVLNKQFFWDYCSRTSRGKSALLELEGIRAMVKIYRRGGLLGKFVQFLSFDRQRSWRELTNYHLVQQASLLTATPIAAVSYQHRGGYYHLLITEFIEGAEDLVDWYARDPEGVAQHKNQLISHLAHTVSRLHKLGIYHPDLNLKNIMVYHQEDKVELALIDFDKAYQITPFPFSLQVDNIFRLNRSAIKLHHKKRFLPLTKEDRHLFLQEYFGDKLDSPEMERLYQKEKKWIALRRIFW